MSVGAGESHFSPHPTRFNGNVTSHWILWQEQAGLGGTYVTLVDYEGFKGARATYDRDRIYL